MKKLMLVSTMLMVAMAMGCSGSSSPSNNPSNNEDAMETQQEDGAEVKENDSVDTTQDAVEDTHKGDTVKPSDADVSQDNATPEVTDSAQPDQDVTESEQNTGTDVENDNTEDTSGNSDTSDTGTDTAQPPKYSFDTPEGIASSGKYIYVVDPAAHYDSDKGTMVYGDSTFTVLDSSNLDAPWVNQIKIPVKNVQSITVKGDHLCFVASGEANFDAGKGAMVPTKPGALYCISTSKAPTAKIDDFTKVDLGLDQNHPLFGFPGSIAIVKDKAFIGSGTTAAAYVVDLTNNQLIKDASAPLLIGNDLSKTGMIHFVTNGSKLIALDFNSDTVYSVDPDSLQVKKLGQIGADPEKMEGPIDGVIFGNTLYVIMGMGNTLWSSNITNWNPKKVTATGANPNAIVSNTLSKELFIANSTDNNIGVYNVASNKYDKFAALETGADPWALTVVKKSNYLAVTAYMQSAVYVFDIKTGNLVAFIK